MQLYAIVREQLVMDFIHIVHIVNNCIVLLRIDLKSLFLFTEWHQLSKPMVIKQIEINVQLDQLKRSK